MAYRKYIVPKAEYNSTRNKLINHRRKHTVTHNYGIEDVVFSDKSNVSIPRKRKSGASYFTVRSESDFIPTYLSRLFSSFTIQKEFRVG
ncbi:hypothetical protein KY345_00705 [Candidatus Woesearchaeota archaeon]|nr:hypothetical protein [Candidatus Woesearchaeota archaeon]